MPQLRTLMRKYEDRPIELADASLVLAASELNDGRILTTDVQDCGVYRWRTSETFDNVLLTFR